MSAIVESGRVIITPAGSGESSVEFLMELRNPDPYAYKEVEVKVIYSDPSGALIAKEQHYAGSLLPGETQLVETTSYVKLKKATIAKAEVFLSITTIENQKHTFTVG